MSCDDCSLINTAKQNKTTQNKKWIYQILTPSLSPLVIEIEMKLFNFK